jgi:hypothetical protein
MSFNINWLAESSLSEMKIQAADWAIQSSDKIKKLNYSVKPFIKA